jgi:hypothetical protein
MYENQTYSKPPESQPSYHFNTPSTSTEQTTAVSTTNSAASSSNPAHGYNYVSYYNQSVPYYGFLAPQSSDIPASYYSSYYNNSYNPYHYTSAPNPLGFKGYDQAYFTNNQNR